MNFLLPYLDPRLWLAVGFAVAGFMEAAKLWWRHRLKISDSSTPAQLDNYEKWVRVTAFAACVIVLRVFVRAAWREVAGLEDVLANLPHAAALVAASFAFAFGEDLLHRFSDWVEARSALAVMSGDLTIPVDAQTQLVGVTVQPHDPLRDTGD